MNMKRIVIVVLTLCLALCMCACGESETTEETKATTGATNAATQPKETEDDGKVTYTVKVVDHNGNSVSGANVQLCKDSCLPGFTDDAGVATFHVVEDPEYKVSFMKVPEGFEAEEAYYFEAGSYEMTITLKPAAQVVKFIAKVTDEGGNAVAGATVQFRREGQDNTDVTTDEKGEAALQTWYTECIAEVIAVPAGYEVVTAEQSFGSEISAEGTLELTFVLKAVA